MTINNPQFYLLFADNEFVVIEDKNLGAMTITNNPQSVINDLSSTYDFKKVKLIYKDTMGVFDGIEVVSGKFVRFIPLRTTQMGKAIELFKGRSMEKLSRSAHDVLQIIINNLRARGIYEVTKQYVKFDLKAIHHKDFVDALIRFNIEDDIGNTVLHYPLVTTLMEDYNEVTVQFSEMGLTFLNARLR